MPCLTKRIVDAAKPATSEFFIWCSSTPGFAVRVYPSGKRVFVCQVRVGRATRRVKIGVYGPYTVDQARQRAQEIIRAAAEGRDPQREKVDLRNAITVAEMCDQYLEAAMANLVTTRFGRSKSPATIKIDEGRIERHLKPLLGNLRARDVTRADVQRMADAVSQDRTRGVFKGKPRGKAVVTGGPVAATRAVGLLGGIYGWAEKRNLVPGPNPAHSIETARGLAKERTLSASELAALGKAMEAKATTSPDASTAIRLIALTGMRREEACGLRWSEIDLAGSCLRLERTKTGRSVRPIGRAARDLLQSVRRYSDEWVFPNSSGTGSADLKKSIAAIFEEAGIHDARSHDLRRTFASVAADEGFSDSTIGDLLGHSRRGVTARHYIRRPDAALVAAADRVSTRMLSALDDLPAATVIELRTA